MNESTKMKHLKWLGLCALLLISSAFNAYSQKLSFCEDYTSSGDPLRVGTEWDITSAGSYVTMIYNQPYNFTQKTVWLYVDQLSNGSYVPYKTMELAVDKYKNWLLYYIFFDKEGKYKVSIMSAGTALATEYLNVYMKGSSGTTTTTTTPSGDIYAGSIVQFCEKMDGASPVGVYSIFNIPSSGGFVNVYVNNNNVALNTTGFIVDVYRMEGGEYKFVETKNYDNLLPSWTYASFQYTFYSAGDYRLSIYTKESKFIKDGYVTIKYK